MSDTLDGVGGEDGPLWFWVGVAAGAGAALAGAVSLGHLLGVPLPFLRPAPAAAAPAITRGL